MVNIGAQLSLHTRWTELIESSPMFWPLEKARRIHALVGSDLTPGLDASDTGYLRSAMWLIHWGRQLQTVRLQRELDLAKIELDIMREQAGQLRDQHPGATEPALQVHAHLSADLRVAYRQYAPDIVEHFDFDVRYVNNGAGDEHIVAQVSRPDLGQDTLGLVILVVIGVTDGIVELAHNAHHQNLAMLAAHRLEDVGFTRQQEPRIATVTFDETMLVDMDPLLATDGADSDTTASDGNGGGDDADFDSGAGMY